MTDRWGQPGRYGFGAANGATDFDAARRAIPWGQWPLDSTRRHRFARHGSPGHGLAGPACLDADWPDTAWAAMADQQYQTDRIQRRWQEGKWLRGSAVKRDREGAAP